MQPAPPAPLTRPPPPGFLFPAWVSPYNAPGMALLLKFLGQLPLPLLHGLGWLAGTLLWWLPNKRKRVALRNIAACLPELSSVAQRDIARRSLIHEAITLFESPRIWFGRLDHVLASVRERRGVALVDEALQHGKGVILLSFHTGPFELAALTHAQVHPISGVYKPQRDHVDRLIHAGRNRYGLKLVPAEGGTVRSILLPALARNETVVFLPDQDPPGDRGVFAPFFGVPANTPTLAGKLVQASGARVVYLYGERLPRGRGLIVHYRAAPEAIYDPDPAVSATAMNAGIEACIRERPEQYWWGYERFRRRPPGEPAFYPKS